MAEIFGKPTGSCRGKGGSMHIADLSKGMLGANGIVGGGPPLICGRGARRQDQGRRRRRGRVLRRRRARTRARTLESLNLASIWNLPAIFVAENNGYAEATVVDLVGGHRRHRRPRRGVRDARRRSSTASTSSPCTRRRARPSARAREGGGPTLIEVKLTRYYGHFEGDQQLYRGRRGRATPGENLDCLKVFRARVTEVGPAHRRPARPGRPRGRDARSTPSVDGAPRPRRSRAPDDLLTDVYVSY